MLAVKLQTNIARNNVNFSVPMVRPVFFVSPLRKPLMCACHFGCDVRTVEFVFQKGQIFTGKPENKEFLRQQFPREMSKLVEDSHSLWRSCWWTRDGEMSFKNVNSNLTFFVRNVIIFSLQLLKTIDGWNEWMMEWITNYPKLWGNFNYFHDVFSIFERIKKSCLSTNVLIATFVICNNNKRVKLFRYFILPDASIFEINGSAAHEISSWPRKNLSGEGFL